VIAESLESLSRILNRDVPIPAGVYFHDWYSDPFFRGAYSYVPVKAGRARRALATPGEDTLYFAGEAADTTGHGGTVHGAIISGRRAASDLVEFALTTVSRLLRDEFDPRGSSLPSPTRLDDPYPAPSRRD